MWIDGVEVLGTGKRQRRREMKDKENGGGGAAEVARMRERCLVGREEEGGG